jgi:hypothetical protein
MARPKKSASRFWSPSQAVFILERALKDRKLSAADIKHYVGSIADEIRSLEERLVSLKDASVAEVKQTFTRAERKVRRGRRKLRKMGGDMPFPLGKKKRGKVMSAARKASQQLQGQYLGYIRQIAKTKRAIYQKISKTAGREEAIAAMKKALGK